jgi:hypothetical protein
MAHVTWRRYGIALAAGLFAAVATLAHEKPSTEIVGVLGLDVFAAASGDVVDALLAVQEPGAPGVELRHTRSKDGGATWSRPMPILPGAVNVFSPRRGAEPQIAAAGDRLVVIWTEPGTSPWGSGPLASAVSADGGRTWAKGKTPADDGTTKDHGFVDVTALGSGSFLAVWLDGRDGGQGLRSAASKDGGATWSRNVDVERRTCECCANRLLVREGSPDVDVIYRGRDPRDTYVARTRDGGSTWSRLGAVARFGWEFDGCPEVAGALASTVASGRERLHALAWTGKDSDVGVWAVASDDRGQSWTTPARMGDESAKQLDMASNGGCVTAVWEQYRADVKRHVVVSSTSCDGGKVWSRPERLSNPDADARHPLAVATPTGVLAAWTERTAARPVVWRSKALPDQALAK